MLMFSCKYGGKSILTSVNANKEERQMGEMTARIIWMGKKMPHALCPYSESLHNKVEI